MVKNFLLNPWTIGIFGGIISGFIVFVITNRIFAKKEDKEYRQKIRLANNELLYSVRPLIVEKKIPSIEIFNSLLIATSKKYSIKIEDLYNQGDLADQLTKEIIDNSFLTSDSKLEYCALTENLKKINIESKTTEETKVGVIYIEKDKSISKNQLSVLLASMSALTALVATLYSNNRSSMKMVSTIFQGRLDSFAFIIVSAIMVPLSAAVLALMIIERRKRREKIESSFSEMDEKGKKRKAPNSR